MKFHVAPRDVPMPVAARRLGMTIHAFEEALPRLIERGFPRRDPDTGNFDLVAIDRWCDARHPHIMAAPVGQFAAKDANTVVADRLAKLRAAHRG